MPSWRVSELMPAELEMFDLVILDESSQSDITTLPALLRGKQILIVGDDQQVSPCDGFVKEEVLEQLRCSHLTSQHYDELLLPGRSIFDLSCAMFPSQRVLLLEHFRCVEPIIEFCNKLCYHGELVPVRLSASKSRLDPPLVPVHVPDGAKTGKVT